AVSEVCVYRSGRHPACRRAGHPARRKWRLISEDTSALAPRVRAARCRPLRQPRWPPLGALISGNKAPLNGGWGSILAGYAPLPSSVYFPYNLFPASDGGFFYGYNNSSGSTVQTVFSDQD